MKLAAKGVLLAYSFLASFSFHWNKLAWKGAGFIPSIIIEEPLQMLLKIALPEIMGMSSCIQLCFSYAKATAF